MVTQAGSNETILVIEDDRDICDFISTSLRKHGFTVASAMDGLSGLKEFYRQQPSAVILDVGIPKMDGWEVCRRIREVTEVPVIFLSAHGQEMDKVRGLGLGADDYMTKPFGSAELVARIAAALRRFRTPAPEQEEDVYTDSQLRIDFARHLVYVDGQPINLSPTEYRLLTLLVRNRGRTLTHDQILERVWGGESEAFDSIKQYISYLRSKLGDDPGNPHYIITVRGEGYRYNKQV